MKKKQRKEMENLESKRKGCYNNKKAVVKWTKERC